MVTIIICSEAQLWGTRGVQCAGKLPNWRRCKFISNIATGETHRHPYVSSLPKHRIKLQKKIFKYVNGALETTFCIWRHCPDRRILKNASLGLRLQKKGFLPVPQSYPCYLVAENVIYRAVTYSPRWQIGSEEMASLYPPSRPRSESVPFAFLNSLSASCF